MPFCGLSNVKKNGTTVNLNQPQSKLIGPFVSQSLCENSNIYQHRAEGVRIRLGIKRKKKVLIQKMNRKSTSSRSSSNGDSDVTVSHEKSMQDIAYEYDDFLKYCAPANENADLIGIQRNELLENLVLKIREQMYEHSERCLDRLEDKLKFLDEVFNFHMQSHAANNLDKLDDAALLEESKMLDQAIQVVEAVVGAGIVKGDEIDFKSIVDDFTSCKKILNDTISTVFKEQSKEVTYLLGDLLKHEFNGKQSEYYLDLGTEEFSDNVVERLIEMGVIEYHPEDDTQIRLARLN